MQFEVAAPGPSRRRRVHQDRAESQRKIKEGKAELDAQGLQVEQGLPKDAIALFVENRLQGKYFVQAQPARGGFSFKVAVPR